MARGRQEDQDNKSAEEVGVQEQEQEQPEDGPSMEEQVAEQVAQQSAEAAESTQNPTPARPTPGLGYSGDGRGWSGSEVAGVDVPATKQAQSEAQQKGEQANPLAEIQVESVSEQVRQNAERVEQLYRDEDPYTISEEEFAVEVAPGVYAFSLDLLESDDAIVQQHAIRAFENLRNSKRTAGVTNNPGERMLVLEIGD